MSRRTILPCARSTPNRHPAETRWAFARKRSSWSTPVRKVARPAIWDVSRAGTELNSTEAELLAVDRNRADVEHALAVLVGKPAE